jgi:hypothetical protein
MDTGRMKKRPSLSASKSDWLNSRTLSLDGCNGTGMIISHSMSGGSARIINPARGPASAETPRYFNAQIASCNGGM